MARTNALICLGVAFQFFDRMPCTGSDLTICVKEGADAGEMMRYLTEVEGYTLKIEDDNEEIDKGEWWMYRPYWLTEMCVLLSKHKDAKPAETRRVQLLSVASCCALGHVVAESWGAPRLNFISWNRAYSLFPHLPFLQGRTEDLIDDVPYTWRITEKVKHWTRGWTASNAQQWQRKSRRWDDSLSWVIDLDTDGIEKPDVPSYFDNQGFAVDVDGQGTPYPERPRIKVQYVSHPLLRLKYGVSDVKWSKFLLDHKLNQLMRDQMQELRPEDRPPYYEEAMARPIGMPLPHYKYGGKVPWQLLKTWKYHDEKLDAWWKEHIRGQALAKKDSV